MEITFVKSHTKLQNKYLHLVSFAEHKHSLHATTSGKGDEVSIFSFPFYCKKEWQE